jgi:hypothetical protein
LISSKDYGDLAANKWPPNHDMPERKLPPSAAGYYFHTDVFFMILLRKIMKNTSVSNLNLARSAMERLFTQPLSKYKGLCKKVFAACGGRILF